MSSEAEADQAELAHLLLAVQRQPGQHALARRQPALLFAHMRVVLQWAAGRHLAAASQATGHSEASLQHAAMWLVRQTCLRPGADPLAVMGLASGFTRERLRDHYRLLIRLTHPDFMAAHEGEAPWPADAAQRINTANDALLRRLGEADVDPGEPAPPTAQAQVVHPAAPPAAWPAPPARPTHPPRATPADAGRLWRGISPRIKMAGAATGALLCVLALVWSNDSGHRNTRLVARPAPPPAATPATGGVPWVPPPGELDGTPEAPFAEPLPGPAAVAVATPAPMPGPAPVTVPAPAPAPVVVTPPPAPRPAVAVSTPPAPEAPVRRTPAAPVAAVAPPPPAPAPAPPPAPPPAPAWWEAAPSPEPQLTQATSLATLAPEAAPATQAAAAPPPAPTPVADPPPPPTRLTMRDVQPQITQLLEHLGHGQPREVAALMAPGAGTDFPQRFEDWLGTGRVRGLGTVSMAARRRDGQLWVDGTAELHVRTADGLNDHRFLPFRARFEGEPGAARLLGVTLRQGQP